jgi:hypothetical protein
MKVLAYFKSNPTDRDYFCLLVHYAVNNAYGGYYKIIVVENLSGLSDILLNGNSVRRVKTLEELASMQRRIETRAKRNSTTIEDGKGNSVRGGQCELCGNDAGPKCADATCIPYEEDDPSVYMYDE